MIGTESSGSHFLSPQGPARLPQGRQGQGHIDLGDFLVLHELRDELTTSAPLVSILLDLLGKSKPSKRLNRGSRR